MSQNINTNEINQKIDIFNIVNKFINSFYYMWMKDTTLLAHSGFIKSFSSLKYENQKYSGPNFFKVLNFIKKSKINIEVEKFNFIDSRSERIDILVIGKITNFLGVTQNFSQTFLISQLNNSWFIKNSILIYM